MTASTGPTGALSAPDAAPTETPAPTAPAPSWQPDRLLDGYQAHTIDLGPDPDGEDPITATLVRRPAPGGTVRGAVLYVHGFTDYFFHEPLADHFAGLGYAFYAVDLRKCGRSLLPQHTPHFTTDLRVYDEELGRSLDVIAREEGTRTPVTVVAHSTGGLITALWLDRLRRVDPTRHERVAGLILDSPWLDLQGDPVVRTLPVTAFIKTLAAVRPTATLPRELSSAYGESIHDSVHGEWSYDLTMKPLSGFPVTFGFLNAVRDGHRALHRGIDVGVPVLVLRSDKTHFGRHYSDATDTADVVLDVAQIGRWSAALGTRVRVTTIPDARHDVFLSIPPARAAAYEAVDAWLAAVAHDGVTTGEAVAGPRR